MAIPKNKSGLRARSLRPAYLLVFSVLACAEVSEQRPVRLAIGTPPGSSLDPIAIPDAVTNTMLSNFYEGLVSFDRDMRIRPALATRWESTTDLVWRFELRAEVRLHDGTPLDSEDVVRALRRARDHPDSALQRYLRTVVEIEALSDSAIELRTEEPDPMLLQRLPHVLIALPAADGRFVGTGPYVPAADLQEQRLEATAFVDHWSGPPDIPSVIFLFGEDSRSGSAAIVAGEVDLVQVFGDPDQLLGSGFRTFTRSSFSGLYLWAGGVTPTPLDDRRVRHAISSAIDRHALARAFDGPAEPLFQLAPRELLGHVPDLELPGLDLDRARELLEESGYASGFELELSYSPRGSVTPAVGLALGEQLQQVGITLRPVEIEWRELITRWRSADLPFFLAGWRFADGDAFSFLRDCMATRRADHGLGRFNPGFEIRDLDELVRELDSITEISFRRARYSTVMRRALEELPIIPLLIPGFSYASVEALQWVPRIDGKVLAVEMKWSSASATRNE